MKMIRKNLERIGLLSAVFMLGALVWNCTEEPLDAPDSGVPCIELTFDSGAGTRAVGTEFSEAEKTMNRVDLFFYAWNATEDSQPVKIHRITKTAHENKETVIIPVDSVAAVFGTENKCRVYAVVNVSDGDYTAAKIERKTATVKALREMKVKTPTFATAFNGFAMFSKDPEGDAVNYDETARKAAGTIRLKNLAAKIDLFVGYANGVNGVDPTDPNSASKQWDVWEPTKAEAYIVSGVKAVRIGGAYQENADGSTAFLGNGEDGYLQSDDYYDSRTKLEGKTYSRNFVTSTESDKDTYPYRMDAPFYSYPNTWTTDPLEQHQTYLLLKVNWLPKDYTSVQDDLVETYYKIPLNLTGEDKDKLVSNKYYRVKVNINTLGGINFGAPLELDACSWEILDWGSAELDADIHEIRWLEVSQTQRDINDGESYTAVMYNTKNVTIPYNTTHKVKIKSVNITYFDYTSEANQYEPAKRNVLYYRTSANKKTAKWAGDKDMGIDVNVFTLTDDKLTAYQNEVNDEEKEPQGIYIDEINQTLTFYHSPYALRGDAVKGRYFRAGIKNYSPYDIEIVLQHEDDPNFTKTITIRQYPAVYITHELNVGDVGFKTTNGSLGTQNRGSIYVNGGATEDWGTGAGNGSLKSNASQLGGVGGKGNADNKNMYSIHVTQLEEDDMPVSRNNNRGKLVIWSRGEVDVNYHVGDPRAKYVNNELLGKYDLLDEADNFTRWTAHGSSSGAALDYNDYREAPADINDGAQRLYPKENSTTIEYYYPTKESQLMEDAWMIAPVFRISSGYAEVRNKGDNLPREYARQRCASFQEQGYPAGRWRLPTIGEFYFFRQFYIKGILPDVFGSDDDRAYWGAQYCFKIDKNDADVRDYPIDNLPSGEKRVRCVYDDWYWKKTDNMTPDNNQNNVSKLLTTSPYNKYMKRNDIRELFVWGDKPKNNPQEQN